MLRLAIACAIFLTVCALQACRIPVETYTPYDEETHQPLPLAVKAEPMVVTQLNEDGSASGAPVLLIEPAPEANDIAPPEKKTDWGAIGIGVLSAVSTILLGTTFKYRGAAQVLTTGVKILSGLADTHADGLPPEKAKANKREYQLRMREAGVEAHIQKIRGKPVKPLDEYDQT